MTCPICGMSSSTYTGIRFPISIRRANKFHEALSIPNTVDVGHCYICFDHFNEKDLIVDEEGIILGVRKEAVPNKTSPNWARQHQIQQDVRMLQFIDCPFCGLQMNGAGRICLLQTHIEAEHGLRADARNLKQIILERRRRIEKIQYYASHIQKHQIGDDEPGTSSCASATVNVMPKVIGNEDGNGLPSIPTNMDNVEMVICAICNEIVSCYKMQIHMYGVHNMVVTNLKMCLAGHRSVAQIDDRKNIVSEKVVEKEKSNQIGYSIQQSQIMPNSSSLIKENEAANLEVKTEIIADSNEEELNQHKLKESSNMETSNESTTQSLNPPLNLFFRTLLNNSSVSIERQNSQEEQMDWALAMTVAVAQEKKVDKKVEKKSRTGNEINSRKVMKEKEMAEKKNIRIPKNNLRPSTINFNHPANNDNELGHNNDVGMNGRPSMAPMNYYKSSNIIRSPSSIPCAKDPIGKWKPLGGILSSEYIPSKRWREEITLSGIDGNNKRQQFCKNKKKNVPNNEEQCSSKISNIMSINPYKFVCPLCHKKWILQSELRHHLIFKHNIPPNSQNLMAIERQSVLRPKQQQKEQTSSIQFNMRETNGPINEEEPPLISPFFGSQLSSRPKPWSVNRLLCTICEQYVQYSNFLTHLAHWHDIHLESEEHIGLYAIAGHGEQLEQVHKSYKQFSDEEKRKIRAYKLEGHSVYWIAKQLGRPHSLVTYILNKMSIPIHSTLNIENNNRKSQEEKEKEIEKEIDKNLEIGSIDEQNGNDEDGEKSDERQQIQYRPIRYFRTTEEERQKVLEYKAQGYSNNWIAHKLGRSHTLINNIVKRMNIKKTVNRPKRGRRDNVKVKLENEEGKEIMEEKEMGDEQPAKNKILPKRKYIRRSLIQEKATNEEENSSIHDELILKRDKFGRNFCVFCERPIHRRHFLQHLKRMHNVEDEEGINESEDEFIQKYCIKLDHKRLMSENIKEERVSEDDNEMGSNAKMMKSLLHKSLTRLKNDNIIPKMEQMEEESGENEQIKQNGIGNNNNIDHDYGCAMNSNKWIRL